MFRQNISGRLSCLLSFSGEVLKDWLIWVYKTSFQVVLTDFKGLECSSQLIVRFFPFVTQITYYLIICVLASIKTWNVFLDKIMAQSHDIDCQSIFLKRSIYFNTYLVLLMLLFWLYVFSFLIRGFVYLFTSKNLKYLHMIKPS